MHSSFSYLLQRLSSEENLLLTSSHRSFDSAWPLLLLVASTPLSLLLLLTFSIEASSPQARVRASCKSPSEQRDGDSLPKVTPGRVLCFSTHYK
ncbi:hypothetical protein CSUI_001851 [Cystoisospora suis]|uniref:Transmembrane protein n=1 Tax=Cystoisospora suis TaxID=483139 RepID=A0A2C6L8V3_9APIC|nr:hypothetical protein CSUI_001851 [Cystoisospora suis]